MNTNGRRPLVCIAFEVLRPSPDATEPLPEAGAFVAAVASQAGVAVITDDPPARAWLDAHGFRGLRRLAQVPAPALGVVAPYAVPCSPGTDCPGEYTFALEDLAALLSGLR
jgi:hypothetical protein